MKTLTAEQIARHAYEAGFRGDGLTTAVAVAIAESGGNPGAHNDVAPDNSYGLWQINMIGQYGPDRRREHDLGSNRDLLDPAVNAEVANTMSKDGTDFTDWAAYNSGAYRRFLDEARRAAKAVSRKDGGGGGGGGRDEGFAVDTGLLTAYVRSTRNVADGLTTVGTTHVRQVRSIADDSFGLIGKESGFAAALDNFGAALQRQVKGVGANADALATSTSKAARAYRDRDDEISGHLDRIQR